jgi:hydrogenase maturation protease
MMSRTILVGLGNPILTDDAVGVVARNVYERLGPSADVQLEEASVGGLGLLDLIVGFEKVVVVDSIKTRDGKPGAIYRFTPEDLRGGPRLFSPHDMDFPSAIEMGRRLGLVVAKEIVIYAIEVADPFLVGEKLTPEIEAAVPAAVETILKEQFCAA